jgi:hypothetical protein
LSVLLVWGDDAVVGAAVLSPVVLVVGGAELQAASNAVETAIRRILFNCFWKV